MNSEAVLQVQDIGGNSDKCKDDHDDVKAYIKIYNSIFTTTSDDYDSHYARDYIMNFDTEGTELNVYFTSNEWVRLEVDSIIFSIGPLSMYANYINSTDPLYIEFTDMKFYNFENMLCVERLSRQEL